ncbi:MAG: organoarsenical effux MFS transporter ArsJ [Arenicella sp.]
MFSSISKDVQQYALITANYWAFTLTDGALRMLVVLYFHQLGYSPLQIAMLFLFYEFFGVVTNLLGGWLGSLWGLNRTMHLGVGLQLLALSMLLVSDEWLTIAWVMSAQALSGIAKDLNKMSAKSAVKLLVPEAQQDVLYRWVAILTGSKNTLKGVGFFLGGLLLSMHGFTGAVLSLVIALSVVWLFSILLLKTELGKSKNKPKFSQLFSKSRSINWLSAARLFLFAARDIWFVVALPVFLSTQFEWSHWQVGAFLATWVIAYGVVQGFAPKLTGKANRQHASYWCLALSAIPACIVVAMSLDGISFFSSKPLFFLVLGLLVFGFLFAVNSSLHSYLIVRLARADSVSMDVGFYYMANAAGRLIGTLLSGYIFQVYGFYACLLISSLFIVISAIFVRNID